MILAPTRLRRAAAAVAAALLAGVLLAAPASAHTQLVASTPGEGDTVAELPEVSLEFTEQLLELGHELVLEAPDGTTTALEVAEPVTEVITATVPGGAAQPGENVLRWRVVAEDGHPIEGIVTFTYAPVAPPTPSVSATPAPSATTSPVASPTPSATASSPSPSPVGAVGEDGAGGFPLGLIVGGGALVAAAAAVALAARRGPWDRSHGPSGQH
ncbi:copper resistance CopC family protein [Demequina sp.]|uniref:copper resistance CopC family protein n=1 Tax=Demequina sp. TaxID=2050685 RepID=UPI0025F174CF|nr:copper resistance CopC family protein [Demequina sp.]